MKTDYRTRVTKKAIQEAFFTLLKDASISKISVRAICELAEINRSTFYRYYMDVYDLLEQIENSHYQHFEREIANSASIDDIMKKTVHNICIRAEEFRLLCSNHCDPGFLNDFLSHAYSRYQDSFEKTFYLPDHVSSKYAFLYIAKGSTGILNEWIQQGFPESEEEICKCILELNQWVQIQRKTPQP